MNKKYVVRLSDAERAICEATIGTETGRRRVGPRPVARRIEDSHGGQIAATGMRVRCCASWVTSRNSPVRWLRAEPVTSTSA